MILFGFSRFFSGLDFSLRAGLFNMSLVSVSQTLGYLVLDILLSFKVWVLEMVYCICWCNMLCLWLLFQNTGGFLF